MAETNATPELDLIEIGRCDAGLMWENACAIGRGYGVETPVAPPSCDTDKPPAPAPSERPEEPQ